MPMSINVLQSISINDDDIDWIEAVLGNISFDECRRNIIKNMDAVDIQAFPGTGKTTVLIAKIAILARKWPYANRGICVLSHTNVAREEIEDRLGQTPVGRKLLSYPHFIGTLHSFFDTFVSMPWLRSNGFRIKIIDNDLVLESRWHKLSYGTKLYLSNHNLSAACCQTTQIPLKINIGCGESTKSYKDVISVIAESNSKGEFTFNEMLLYASDAFINNPSLTQNIQSRFPMLLIDEAQDTSIDQWALIKSAFTENSCLSVRQSFGDSNQAIFNSYQWDEAITEFPRKNALTIANSKRFNASIARLADPLSLMESGMIGEATEFDNLSDKHTIFLFDKTKIGSLIPTYAQFVLECFSDEILMANQKYGCHVIGMVHSINETVVDPAKFPRSVCDYWGVYNPSGSGRSANPKYLVEYFRFGHQAFCQEKSTYGLVDWISRGLRRYINMNVADQIPSTTNAFRAMCQLLSESKESEFRNALFSIMFFDISNKDSWLVVAGKIQTLMIEIFELPATRNDMLAWQEIPDNTVNAEAYNTYVYNDRENHRSVQLTFGSIHSVKGRTHLSTLVIDTFWHKSNIQSLLPWLCKTPPKKTGIQNATRIKCHYVALTRAKGLICMALPVDSVDEATKDKIILNGWNIKVLQ